MRLDLAAVGDSDVFDFCVVGSGPAGITCAWQLAKGGKRVILLEAGGRDPSEASQNIYEGKIVGDLRIPLTESRLRYFGGTSNHWAGQCRPLDAADFAGQIASADTAWPIARADLDPYLEPASAILEIPPVPPDTPIRQSGLKRIHFVYSPPVRFATKYGAGILAHQSLFLVLDANLSHFETNGAAIQGAVVRNYEGLARTVRAGAYVLAAGGIENSRLLLWSNVQTHGQTVPNPLALGRYWMPHPTFPAGDAILVSSLLVPFERGLAFAPTAATMRDDRILNIGIGVTRHHYGAARWLVAEMACVAPRYGQWALEQLNRNVVCATALRAAWEAEPRFVSRIELGQERDSFGMPRAVLFWQRSALDHRTIQATARRFAGFLADTDNGRARLAPFALGEGDYPAEEDWGAGTHHMGGTRMAAMPDKGIVDGDCKVFGQANLFIAGSSVFPSSGHTNPTLTIVQLALRLADHLLKGARS
ncbi:MAG: GMC family oxidoreductase [Bauldia sp.]